MYIQYIFLYSYIDIIINTIIIIYLLSGRLYKQLYGHFKIIYKSVLNVSGPF